MTVSSIDSSQKEGEWNAASALMARVRARNDSWQEVTVFFLLSSRFSSGAAWEKGVAFTSGHSVLSPPLENDALARLMVADTFAL